MARHLGGCIPTLKSRTSLGAQRVAGRTDWRKAEDVAVAQAPVRRRGAWPLLFIRGHLYSKAGEDRGWSVTPQVKASCHSSPGALHRARCPEHGQVFLGHLWNEWLGELKEAFLDSFGQGLLGGTGLEWGGLGRKAHSLPQSSQPDGSKNGEPPGAASPTPMLCQPPGKPKPNATARPLPGPCPCR